MKGCIPLSDSEIKQIIPNLKRNRDKLLLILGVTTGLRITELLSLKIKDVISETGTPLDYVYVRKSATKRKQEGKAKKLLPIAIGYLLNYISELDSINLEEFLFQSQKGSALDRRSAWRIIASAAKSAGFSGKIGTHTMRKSYAKKVYDATGGDYMQVKMMLGHKSVASTEQYLQFVSENEHTEKLEWNF